MLGMFRSTAPAGLVLACVVGASAVAAADPPRELNFIPVLGGDSDIGFGLGGAGNLAQLAPPGIDPPYRWRIDGAGFVTFNIRTGRGFVLPFQDYNAQLGVPRLGPAGAIRLETRLAFTNEQTLRYYGIGNASPPLGPDERLVSIEYERLHPTLSLEARAHMMGRLYVLVGTSFTYNHLDVP